MNSIMITGTAGQDAETRATQTGKMLVRFSMAIYNGKDAQGEYKPSTWLQVVAFDNDLAQTVKKGDRVNISGRLTGDVWQDKNGNKRETWKVIADAVLPVTKPTGTAANSGNGFNGLGTQSEECDLPF